VEQQLAKMERYKLETDNDLDKMRIQLAELTKLLKSPIADLPAKTEADTDFRQAYYHLLNGEFDIAADAFDAWRKKYPKDPRGPEALYRRGQAFFLMRKYDHALIPLSELVDKSPKSDFATPARWILARSLEETGDLKLARQFYAELINDRTPYAADATRRVALIDRLFPHAAAQGSQGSAGSQGGSGGPGDQTGKAKP
jgi:TolA-binding protein